MFYEQYRRITRSHFLQIWLASIFLQNRRNSAGFATNVSVKNRGEVLLENLIWTHVLCTIQEEFLIDYDMFPHLCTIRPKIPPHSVMYHKSKKSALLRFFTHVLCTIQEEFLIDVDMILYLRMYYIDKESCHCLYQKLLL